MPFGEYPIMRSREEEEDSRRAEEMRKAREEYNKKRPGASNQPRRAEEAPKEAAPAAPAMNEAAISPQELAAKASAAQGVLNATSPMMMATNPVSNLPPMPAGIQPGFFNPNASTPPAISGNITPAADLGYSTGPGLGAPPSAQASPLYAGLRPNADLRAGQSAPSVGGPT